MAIDGQQLQWILVINLPLRRQYGVNAIAQDGDAQRMHGFADHVFAQHGAQRRASIAGARIGRASGALDLKLEVLSTCGQQLGQSDGAAGHQFTGAQRHLHCR